MLVAHEFLACDDPELDELIKISAKALMKHIIDSNYEFLDFSGQPTTWAKWSTRYFDTDFGWGDAPLNAAEVLMYHLVTMRITGEQGEWRKSYEHLINDLGYADISEKHFDRLYQMSLSMGFDFPEEIMYGDHMLAVCAFTGLCLLEKDETLLAKYRAGFKSWRTSLEREHNPGYDIPFMLSCPDEEVDLERMASWFYRTNISRLAAGVSCQAGTTCPLRSSVWARSNPPCCLSRTRLLSQNMTAILSSIKTRIPAAAVALRAATYIPLPIGSADSSASLNNWRI